jgi:ribosomal protein S18 acetylase RimI-like enzyme
MRDPADIEFVEALAFNAWPALRIERHGDWEFRLSKGFTKRANSANAIRPTGADEAVRLAAENVYARHGLPAIFRLSPLASPEMDALLDRAGYDLFDPSIVMLASSVDGVASPDVDIAEVPSQDWLDGFAAANAIDPGNHATHAAMVAAIGPPAGFATLRKDGEAIGFGLAVVEDGVVGLFDIVVAAAHRGTGRGRALTESLLHWSRRAGATSGYIQVREQNAVARRLYHRIGFREAYRYHYRVPGAGMPGAQAQKIV